MTLLNDLKNNKTYRSLVIAAILLTLIRIWLAMKTPLYLQADADYDDWLLTKYAYGILQLDWIGEYGCLSMVKVAAFPAIMAVFYLLGIPFAFGLIGMYTVACVLLTKAIGIPFRNKWFEAVLYICMLYSPVMFTEDNFQHVYRDGYIIVFASLTVAGVIGIYFNSGEKKKSAMAPWIVIEAISLPVFYLMKEDTIWLIPLVAVGNLAAVIRMLRTKFDIKLTAIRVICIAVPLITLAGTVNLYKLENYRNFGVYAMTDRGGTYFGRVMSDLLKIDTELPEGVWVTRDALVKAIDASPTMQQYSDELLAEYDGWTRGEAGAIGDYYIWSLRNGFNEAGVYDDGGAHAEEIYKQIHNELQTAFEAGTLNYNSDRLYLSSVTRGYTIEELANYVVDRMPVIVTSTLDYRGCEVTMKNSRGSLDNMVIMDMLTHADCIWPEASNNLGDWQYRFVRLENGIISIYRVLGMPIALISMAGLLLLIIKFIKEKETRGTTGRMLLIIAGLLLTCAEYMFAVVWYCADWLQNEDIYNYSSALVPMIQAVQAVGIYYLILFLLDFMKKHKLQAE